nr:MAG: methyltransferase [Chemarfal virus 151]
MEILVGLNSVNHLFQHCAANFTVKSYVCLKENLHREKGSELVCGPRTNQILLSMGLAKSTRFLNDISPDWLLFIEHTDGIKFTVRVSEEMIKFALTSLERIPRPSWYTDLCVTPGAGFTPLSSCPGVDLKTLRSMGSRLRKHVLDQEFALGHDLASFVSSDADLLPKFRPDRTWVCYDRAVRTGGLFGQENRWLSGILLPVYNEWAGVTNSAARIVLVNWMQPRWTVRFSEHGSWVARLNRSLLAQAGDVEKNPGPPVLFIIRQFLLGVTIVYACVLTRDTVAVTGIPSLAYHMYDAWVLKPLDEKAYECAIEKREHEFWAEQYHDPTFVQMSRWMRAIWPDTTVPLHSEIGRQSYSCHVVFWFRGIPEVPSFVHVSWFMVLYQYVKPVVKFVALAYVAASLCVCFVGSALVVFYVARRGRVVVINNNGAVSIVDIKKHFKPDCPKPTNLVGHSWLASQRREAENMCITWILGQTKQFRDVGGSRSRWAELGKQKHICCPNYSNDDILRDLKSPEIFDNCRGYGQDCPSRKKIPFAILSHVDYHMSQDELVRTITGPTFVINHNFSARPVTLATIDAAACKSEARLTYHGSQLRMTTSDGTTFEHSYHPWANEGSVVTNSGAFIYAKVCEFADTQVLFCYPAAGVYKRTDVNAMPKPHDSALPMINGYSVSRELGDETYTFHKSTHTFTVPASIVEHCAIQLAFSARDEKYAQSLTSFTASQMKTHSASLSNVDEVVRLVAYLADMKSVTTAYVATCIQGHPVDFRWYDLYRLRAVLWVRNHGPLFARECANRLLESAPVKKCFAWTFPKVIVPTYEINSRMNRSSFLNIGLTKYKRDCFRPSPAPADARGSQHSKRCTGEDTGEHDNISGNAGFERRAPTAPPADERDGEGAGERGNAGSAPPAPPPGADSRDASSPTDGHRCPSSEKGHYGDRPAKTSGDSGGRGSPCDEHVHPVPDGRVPTGKSDDGKQPNAQFVLGSSFTGDAIDMRCETAWPCGKDTVVRLGADVARAVAEMYDHDQDSLCEWIDAILSDVLRLELRINKASVIKQLCRFAVYQDIAKETWLSDVHGGSVLLGVFDSPFAGKHGTHAFQRLVCQVSTVQAQTANKREEGDRVPGVADEGSSDEKFSQDRNLRQRNRPEKHQPKERRNAKHIRPLRK